MPYGTVSVKLGAVIYVYNCDDGSFVNEEQVLQDIYTWWKANWIVNCQMFIGFSYVLSNNVLGEWKMMAYY